MTPTHLPKPTLATFHQLDYLSNRLKLEYLVSLLEADFNPVVLRELVAYYHKEVALVGGMNEAFRWFVGRKDVESVQELPDGTPFSWKCIPRQRKGNLLKRIPRNVHLTCQSLNRVCQDLCATYAQERSLSHKVAMLAEFMAIKVTCHDLFIHGRSPEPARELFHKKHVHIDHTLEAAYVQKVLEAPFDQFRLKNVLSYAMAHGIDPVACLAGDIPNIHAFRPAFLEKMRNLLEMVTKLDPQEFFFWDDYGMCNFVEGPVFLRKTASERSAAVPAHAWQSHDWDEKQTCSTASAQLARQAFQIFFDHSAILTGGSVGYFSDRENQALLLPPLKAAFTKLEAARSIAEEQDLKRVI